MSGDEVETKYLETKLVSGSKSGKNSTSSSWDESVALSSFNCRKSYHCCMVISNMVRTWGKRSPLIESTPYRPMCANPPNHFLIELCSPSNSLDPPMSLEKFI